MKSSSLMKFIPALALCAFLGLDLARAQGETAPHGGGEAPLTNAAVIKLVRAGFREKTVVAIIRSRPVQFNLAPERLIELKKNGVSERIILAMLSRTNEAAVIDGGEWGEEGFFEDEKPSPGSPRTGGAGGEPGETNIFGSSGGSRGRTRSRGGNNSNEGDTQTTGSATVRILRPPAEAGGAAALKLERTPTLTNDSIVELVEGGFSEGTIIRRIEQSPADYNLSPDKLAELRRRRVSETIIAAMKAAMSEGEHPTAQ